jgi:hypothetical protein
MSNQAVFDAALKHIRKQGKPSMDEAGDCYYRSPEGLQCAFAPCIAIYDGGMEAFPASYLLDKWNGCLHEWAQDCHPDLADEIQRAHDENGLIKLVNLWNCPETVANINSPFVKNFEERMQSLAKYWDLKYE